LDALCGPVFYRALVTGGPIPRTFTGKLVDDVPGPAHAQAKCPD
jgi:hypothetical protein